MPCSAVWEKLVPPVMQETELVLPLLLLFGRKVDFWSDSVGGRVFGEEVVQRAPLRVPGGCC